MSTAGEHNVSYNLRAATHEIDIPVKGSAFLDMKRIKAITVKGCNICAFAGNTAHLDLPVGFAASHADQSAILRGCPRTAFTRGEEALFVKQRNVVCVYAMNTYERM